MAVIRNVGNGPFAIQGNYLYPGESREVTDTLARSLRLLHGPVMVHVEFQSADAPASESLPVDALAEEVEDVRVSNSGSPGGTTRGRRSGA